VTEATTPLPSPELSEVAPGVLAYIQPDGSWMVNNTGAVVGRSGVVLIDTTSTEARNRALLAAVGEHAGGLPVRAAVNTHHHGDHTYGNWLLPAGVPIVAHRRCRDEVLRAGMVARALFPTADYGQVELAPPTLTFESSVTLHVDETRVELLFVGPAHTLGDVIAWLPDRGVAFTGDLVFHGGHPFLAEGCLANYPEALERVRGLGARVLVPGHGPLAAPDVLDSMLDYAQWLTALARDGFAAGQEPLEVALRADLKRFATWSEPERLVGNLARAYSELRGEPWGTPLDLPAVARDMMEFNGGPLRCLA
jgi:glyoxylase-like metal-dependent hydrolase (beta-lactamase superfamily II)